MGGLLTPVVPAQDKKPDNLPQLLNATPLGAVAGQTTKVVLRGKRLDEVKELQLNGQATAVKILSKGKAAVPQKQDANRAGDTQLEVELSLTPDAKPGECELIAVSESGRSMVFKLLVDAQPVATEKEPNDGFAQAQSIEIGATIEGTLHQPQNVDVFRFDGQAGEKLVCEVIAARRGSALDATLTLFDSRRRLIDTADDLPSDAAIRDDWSLRDARLEITLPSSGAFLLVLQDANDLGGPAHPYRLRVVRATK
ncbi:MAG: hypothetical protein IAG10_06665 [Planctomycetaceae bacterium]|nr:hypothetical protein [Planctomycetaceae bacterium]